MYMNTFFWKYQVIEQSVAVPEDGLVTLRRVEDVLITHVLKIPVGWMLIAKTDKERLFVLVGIHKFCMDHWFVGNIDSYLIKIRNTYKLLMSNRPNYEGDPFINCELNPCLTDLCGINADCQKSGRQALCTCREGYTGDAFVRYLVFKLLSFF